MRKSWNLEDYETISQKYSNELDVLYSNYKKVLYFLVKRGLSYEDAQDAAQDAYIEAISCLPSLKNKEAVVSWLFTIASRVCNKYLAYKIKKNNNELALELCQEDGVIDRSASISSEEQIEDALGVSKKEVLRKNLLKLGEVEQKVLIMYYTYQYDYREIALRLKINHSTVRSISKRAKEKLRRLILEDELNSMI